MKYLKAFPCHLMGKFPFSALHDHCHRRSYHNHNICLLIRKFMANAKFGKASCYCSYPAAVRTQQWHTTADNWVDRNGNGNGGRDISTQLYWVTEAIPIFPHPSPTHTHTHSNLQTNSLEICVCSVMVDFPQYSYTQQCLYVCVSVV